MTDKMLSPLGSKGRDTGFVFTATGDRPINNLGRTAKRLRTLMQTLAEDLGMAALEEWRPHDLRSTAASGMARCGIYQEVIERVQNRISGKFAGVAGIYNRYDYEKEKREALSKWSSDVHRVTLDVDKAYSREKVVKLANLFAEYTRKKIRFETSSEVTVENANISIVRSCLYCKNVMDSGIFEIHKIELETKNLYREIKR